MVHHGVYPHKWVLRFVLGLVVHGQHLAPISCHRQRLCVFYSKLGVAHHEDLSIYRLFIHYNSGAEHIDLR